MSFLDGGMNCDVHISFIPYQRSLRMLGGSDGLCHGIHHIFLKASNPFPSAHHLVSAVFANSNATGRGGAPAGRGRGGARGGRGGYGVLLAPKLVRSAY